MYERFKDRLTDEERAEYETYRRIKDDKSTAVATEVVSFDEVPTAIKRWQNGRTLHIRFLDGDPDLRKRVGEVAQEWTKYANLRFSFDSASDAEIRISFEKPGSWSYMGTDARMAPQQEPTMGFGYLKTKGISQAEFRRSVLHEFGHVLGLIHEHQNPKAVIPWDRAAVHRYFGGPPYNWTKLFVDANFFAKYRGDYRSFDPQSIMMYFPIRREFLRDNSFPPILTLSTELSQSDKEFVAKLYPKP